MKAVRFLGDGKVDIAEVPMPTPDSESVILRVKASGLCGSELGHYKGTLTKSVEFNNPGHEVAGVIEQAPPGCGYHPGMRVGARVVQGCGHCSFCDAGYETACTNRSTYACDGHAEYFKLGLNGLQPIPDEVDWPEAVVLTGDCLGVAVRASRRLGETSNKSVVVLGLGPIGLSLVFVLTAKGAKVMGGDFSQYRVDLALRLGAVSAVNVGTCDLPEAVSGWTRARGADIVLLAAGNEKACEDGLAIVRQQGIVYQVAELPQWTMNPSAAFIYKEITMTGSWYYTSGDWPDMLALHRRGIPYRELISHVLPFTEAQEAYNIFASGNSGKVVLVYD